MSAGPVSSFQPAPSSDHSLPSFFGRSSPQRTQDRALMSSVPECRREEELGLKPKGREGMFRDISQIGLRQWF